MPKWLKILLGVVLSVAVFAGVAAAVYDAHPLRQDFDLDACVEQARYSTGGSDHCYDESRRATDRGYENDRWLAVGVGAAAVGLFWLLANLFYFRRRRPSADGDVAG